MPPKDNQAPPAEGAKPAADAKNPGNPLTDLIKNVFRPASKTPSKEEVEKENKNDGEDEHLMSAGDQTDKRAPHDPEHFSLLQKAVGKAREKNWNEALEILEFLLERGGHSTVRLANGRRVPLSEEANRLLGSLPAEVRENYRLKHGQAAAQILAEAAASGDPRRYALVATRYFHTAAGYDAANHLGTLHYDRGEFGMAARWFNLLIDAGAPMSRETSWRLKAIFALRQSGDRPESDRLLSELSTDPQPQDLEVGGMRLNPRDWIARLQPRAADAMTIVDEWPIFGGLPSRFAVANGGEPLLLSRWTRPVTESHPLRAQIAMLTQDLGDQQRATIPALFPLMINNRIIYRTLRGVQVLDAATGETLWETREGVSAERMLLGGELDDGENIAMGRRGFNRFNINGPNSDYFGGGGESHPLVGLLYRNGAFGILASDSRQLFVIEDHAMLSRLGYYGAEFDPEGDDPFQQNWSTNRLVSYDLNSGRPLWTVGGVAMNEPFDLPLAGTYFLGAPLVDGGELLVVGEKDGQIHLFALDPANGTPRWSQLIAYADTKIERDIARRWWTAQVACGNGVIVCPTTVGWLVGIDRLSHSVLWTQRYTQPVDPRAVREGREDVDSMVAFSELNSQWSPSAPVIVGSRVVYTPSEEASIVCVDLFDGKTVWQHPKGDDGLYLAGVFDDRVVVVGRNAVTSRAMRDGSVQWTIRFEHAEGRPSGVGVAAKNGYYLPLSSGELWLIDVSIGKVTQKSKLPENDGPLGNLAFYRGKFLSLSAQGMTSYEQRAAAEAEIRRAKEANPHDPQALLHEAEIFRVDRKYAKALESLRAMKPDDVPELLVRRYRSAMLDSLAGVIRGDQSGAQREIDELAAFATTPDEKWTHRTLLVERFAANKEYASAFDLLLDAAGKLDDAQPLAGTDPDTMLDATVWVASRLAEFWAKMDAEARKRFDERISAQAKAALDGDLASRRRAARMFPFHTAIPAVEDRLVEDYSQTGDVALAENILLRRSRRAEPEMAARALERLGRLLLDAGLPRDAEQAYRDLERRFPDVPVVEKKTARELVTELVEKGTFGAAVPQERTAWGEFEFRVERTGTGYLTQHIQEVDAGAARTPFFQDHRIQIDERRQRLEVIGARDETQHWLLPLRSGPRPLQGEQVVARASGHMLYLLHRDVLHCLSPVDRKVLWTRVLDVRGSGAGYYRVPQRASLQPLRSGASFLSRNSVLHFDRGDGMLAAVNGECICIYGRRQFTVLDALTGDVRWTRSNVPPNSSVIATDDVLYFVPPDRKQAAAYHAADGRRIESKDVGSLLAKAVAVLPQGIVVSDADGKGAILGLSAKQTVVRLMNPLNQEEIWSRPLPGGTAFALLDETRLVSVEAGGVPSILDLESGEMQRFETGVAAEELKSKPDFYALADRDRLYFVMNRRRGTSDYYYQDGFQSLQVSGTVYAFDLHSRKELWRQTVASQNLVSQFLNYSPALLFVSRSQARRGENARGNWALNVLAIDKETGRKLIDTKLPTYGGFRTLDLNMAERFIELRSHNQRVRLVAVARQK